MEVGVATFVLVPGGWRGGWYFQPLTRQLRQQGHAVYPITLTGLGERRHLRSASVNLETHIEDVVRVLECEQIQGAILCGHSYGGMVVSGVADRVPKRLAALVYCDAYVPDDGDSCFSLAGDSFRQVFLDGARADGISVAAPNTLDPRVSAHPLGSFLQAIHLTGAWATVRRREFVYLSGWEDLTPFRPTYERLRADPAWNVHTLPVGHDIIGQAPDALLEILLRAASALTP
jgi:pimeloyl-ACP methyl ester carboxylesterase